MVFLATGLNYKTAPLLLREKMALVATSEYALIERLLEFSFIHEALVLSTCNRTEIYCKLDEPKALIPILCDICDIKADELLPHLYQHEHDAGVQHLLRVASGLDSMMLGEPQILGQLKQAVREAEEKDAIKQHLRHIFSFALSASKRIRNQSGIGNNPISIASAAVRLIGQFFPSYEPLEIFIIGSGETAALVAKYLYQQGVRKFTIASRTRENADQLALKWHARALSIMDIPAYLPRADVVISATACPLPFVDKLMVEQAIEDGRERPLFFLDLAVPRDISPDVAELSYAHLYNIDDLHQVIEHGLTERRRAAAAAEALIVPALEQYSREHRVRSIQHLICDYRDNMQALTTLELQRATQKIKSGQCEHAVLEEFSNRIFNKLTHRATIGLQQLAADARPELLELAQYLLTTENQEISSQHEEIT